MGISIPHQQYLLMNSGVIMTEPAVNSEFAVTEPARIVVMTTQGYEAGQTGRSSITITRRQEEDVIEIPPLMDTVMVRKEVKSLESLIKTLPPFERASIERRGPIGAWGNGEADRLLDQNLDRRLATMNVLRNSSMVMEKKKANLCEAKEWNVQDMRAAQKEKRKVEAEKQEEKKKQREDRVRVDLEKRDERRKADAEEVVRSRTEWIRMKKKMKLKKDRAMKEVKEIIKKKLEKKAGGEKRLGDIKKAAFHRDKYHEARVKMLFHIQGYSKIEVDVDLEDFFPSTDKDGSKAISKRAKEFRKKKENRTKPEDKKVQGKLILKTKAEMKKKPEEKAVLKKAEVTCKPAEKSGLVKEKKEKKAEENMETEVVELWLSGQEKEWKKLE